jgi:hypothetical protein
MDWLILLLLIPAIIVPIVLLCGFAGCTPFTEDTTKPAAPANLAAMAVPGTTDSIKLTWDDTSGGTAKFDVERTAPKAKDTLKDKLSGFVDGGLDDGTDFSYDVKAIVAGVESLPSNEAKATTHPKAPTNLVATPEEVNQIVLKWNHVTNSNKTIKFKIKHTLKTPPGGTEELTISPTKSTTYTHPHTVAEGSGHEYQVAAVVDGFDNSVSKSVESDLSGPVSAKPLAFKAVLTTDQPPNGPNLEGYCLIQKIPSALLKNTGTKVKITVRGSNVGDLTIDKIFISRVRVAPPGDPYDSRDDLVQVASAVSLLANTEKTLGINYEIPDPPQDLLIAFDISPMPGQGNVRFASPVPGALLYYKANTKEAATPIRSLGYVNNPALQVVYLVEKIEVL